MDEVLKRRLVGTAVLLLLAFLLTSLLPRPGPEQAAEGEILVTVGLDAPPPAAGPVAGAPAQAGPESQAPAPPDGPAAVNAETVADPASGPAADPKPAEPVAAPASAPEPEPAPVQKPQLKMESALASAKAAPRQEKPAPAAKPAPKKPAEASAPPAPPGPAWYVQVASFNDVDKARLDAERFRTLGFKPLISPAETATGTWYRVRLGPYATRDEADKARAKVAGQAAPQATVVGG